MAIKANDVGTTVVHNCLALKAVFNLECFVSLESQSGVRPPTGPEALEFREENSTNFAKGILTLVPLERIRSIDYDNDKQVVTARVATGEMS